LKLKSYIRLLSPKTKKSEVRDLEKRIANLEKMVNTHTKVINSIALSYPEAVKSIGNLAEVQAELSKSITHLGISVKKLDAQANANLIKLFRD